MATINAIEGNFHCKHHTFGHRWWQLILILHQLKLTAGVSYTVSLLIMLHVSQSYNSLCSVYSTFDIQALTRLSSNEDVVYGLLMHEIIHAIGFSNSLFSR